MNFIVYDTEFSQPQPKLYNANSGFRPNPISPFEVIEIGAVKVNENLEITDSFQRLVRPVIYKRLSPIVVRKTGITKRELVTKGENFRKVIQDFKKWAGRDFILCTWSSNDMMILRKNCRFHRLECDWLHQYYDVQKYCSRLLGLPEHQAIGLKRALNTLQIDVEGKLHRALEDAFHTAKILVEVLRREESPVGERFNFLRKGPGSSKVP